MNINVASWGRLLKRSTPSIQNQQNNSVTDSAISTPSITPNYDPMSPTPQPLQLVFDSEADDFETVVAPGENPDINTAGLSGARPLGMFKLLLIQNTQINN